MQRMCALCVRRMVLTASVIGFSELLDEMDGAGRGEGAGGGTEPDPRASSSIIDLPKTDSAVTLLAYDADSASKVWRCSACVLLNVGHTHSTFALRPHLCSLPPLRHFCVVSPTLSRLPLNSLVQRSGLHLSPTRRHGAGSERSVVSGRDHTRAHTSGAVRAHTHSGVTACQSHP